MRKKKTTSKNRRYARLVQTRHSKSIDSLYSSSNEGKGTSDSRETESETESTSDAGVHRSVLIREVPKVGKFNVYGPKDVKEFFKEYESYCREKFGENTRFWVKELGEFLEGRLYDFYRAIVSVGEPKFEVVKERVIDQVKRVKSGVKYRKKNDFEDAQMGKNERLDMYAHRLESLARKRFGDEGINENKDLMKKFLGTIPNKVGEYVNARRKDKKRWTGERLLWEEVLEIVEDREFGENDREDATVYAGGRVKREVPEFRSYKEALMANPVDVMAKFLDEYYGQNEETRGRKRVYVGQTRAGMRDTSVGRERSMSVNRSVSRNARVNMNNEVKCVRCNRMGHVRSNCRWALGQCLGCGQTGHLVKDCPNPRMIRCFKCGRNGHFARECRNGGSTDVGAAGMCGNCGLMGHFSRMCTNPRSVCEKCGMNGHLSRLCRNGERMDNGVVNSERTNNVSNGAVNQGN